MDNESARIIGVFLTYVLGGLVLGTMASVKNRNYWAWGLIGGLFWFPCIIAMVFLPYLCPKCQRPLTTRERRRRVCPTCGSYCDGQQAEQDGYALLARGTKLERQGRVKEAMVTYQQVTEKYPGTIAARDAQKSEEDLRSHVG
jgi:hypothetical protein